MTLPPGDVAAPLYTAVGPDAFAKVSEWLNDVAAEHSLEVYPTGQIAAPSVAWLAEAVAFYDPRAGT
jgi:hypothetical protein